MPAAAAEVYTLAYFYCQQLVSDIRYDERFTDMSSLGVPAVASSRKQMKTQKKTTKTLKSFLPFRGPVVGGDTFTRLIASPFIGLRKKVAMSPSSTIVHEGQYDISRVSVSWLVRAGGSSPLSQIRLAQSTRFGIIFSPTSSNLTEGDIATFFLQDLGLALSLATKTCPH